MWIKSKPQHDKPQPAMATATAQQAQPQQHQWKEYIFIKLRLHLIILMCKYRITITFTLKLSNDMRQEQQPKTATHTHSETQTNNDKKIVFISLIVVLLSTSYQWAYFMIEINLLFTILYMCDAIFVPRFCSWGRCQRWGGCLGVYLKPMILLAMYMNRKAWRTGLRRGEGGCFGMGLARERQVNEYIRKLYLIATDMLYCWL